MLLMFTTSGLKGQTQIDSLRRLVTESSGTAKIDRMLFLSRVLLRVDIDEALELVNESLRASDSLGYSEGKTQVRQVKAAIFLYQRKLTLAYEQLMEAKALGVGVDSVDFNVTLGNIYLYRGQHDKALEAYLEAYDLAKISWPLNIQATCLSNISLVYLQTGNLDKGLEYITQAIEIYERAGMDIEIGQAYMNYSSIEWERKNFGVSIEYIERAIEMFKKVDAKPNLAVAFSNLGYMYSQMGRIDEAFKCYDQAMSLLENLKDGVSVGVLFLNRAKAFQAQNKMNNAISEGKKAIVSARENNYAELAKNTYLFLFEVYESREDNDKALENFKAYIMVKDSMAENANKQRVQQLTANFEFEKKENELKTSEESLESARNEQELSESRQLILVIAMALLIGIIALLIFSYRSYMARAKLKQDYLSEKTRNTELSKESLHKELALKDNALKEYLERIQQKNDLISSIEDKLTNLEKEGAVGLNNENISELALSVKRKVIRSITWEEFRLKFDEVHQQFVPSLVNKHTELTNNELDICVLLKINLANKEIAQTLNMSYDSVKKSLQRLYRKLGLNSNEELRLHIVKF